MESKLTGQTAIVTGGGRGFGREIARALGKYDALTGRWVSPKDNLDEMLRHIEEIEKDELYIM